VPAHHGLVGAARGTHLDRGLRLAVLTVAWSLVEAGAGLALAVPAGSVALLGFGLDAALEGASSTVIAWRIMGEGRARDEAHLDRIERRAGRLVAAGLAALALYVVARAVLALARHEHAQASRGGVLLGAVSMAVMQALARGKRRVARALDSPAMAADAFQSAACFYLAFILLAGTGLNALFGLWWADPAAALLMGWPLASEARKAWSGEHRH